jgi:hypothetical protein
MSNHSDFIDLTILMRDDNGDSDRIMPVKIEKEATIGDLKTEIERMTEIPAKIQQLWCEKDSMEPLEDEVSIWSFERVGSEIVLQICSSEITVKVHTTIFNKEKT